MTEPCQQIERIVHSETLVMSMVSSLDTLNSKMDRVLKKVGSLEGKMDTYEKRPHSNSFVGGVAAVGIVFGGLLVDVVKPFLKTILAALVAVIK